MSDVPALRVRDLTRTFGTGPNAVPALTGLSLSLDAGSFTAVMGPSGSGKSTLLNLVAGLDRPTSGGIEIGGEDITRWTDSELAVLRRQRVGVVFQQFELVPYLTAAGNLGLPARLAGGRADPERLAAALSSVGLADKASALPSQLSGGQQQRVAIARAMLGRPELLLADEPTGALDSVAGRTVLRLLRAAADSRSTSILMVTHDATAAAYADRVLFLYDGRLAASLTGPDPMSVAERLADLEARSAQVA